MGWGKNLPAGGPNYPFSMSPTPAPKAGPLPCSDKTHVFFHIICTDGAVLPKGAAPGRRRRQPSCQGPRKVVACAPAYRWPQELTFRFEGWVPLGRRPLNFTLTRAETEQIKPYVYLVKSLKIYTETGIYRTGLHVNGIMNNNYRY